MGGLHRIGAPSGDSITVRMVYEHELYIRAWGDAAPASNPNRETSDFTTAGFDLTYETAGGTAFELYLPYRRTVTPKVVSYQGKTGYFLRRRQGIGDAIALVSHRRAVKSIPLLRSVTIGGGFRLPTGDANPDADWTVYDAETGTKLGTSRSRDPVLQPGAGSLDPILLIHAEADRGRWHAMARGLYRHSGARNAYGYRYGNELEFAANATARIGSGVRGGWQLRYMATEQDSDVGAGQAKKGTVMNTGGRWLWWGPVLAARGKTLHAELQVDFPLYRHVRQSQLVSDYRTTLSVGVTFGLQGPRRDDPATPEFKGDPEHREKGE